MLTKDDLKSKIHTMLIEILFSLAKILYLINSHQLIDFSILEGN